MQTWNKMTVGSIWATKKLSRRIGYWKQKKKKKKVITCQMQASNNLRYAYIV